MKTFFITLFFTCSLFSYAQMPTIGEMDYNLRILNGKGTAYSGAKVVFTEIETKEKIFKTADTQGKVQINLVGGKEWEISVEKIRNNWSVRMPERGKGSGSRTISYDYKRWQRENRPSVDRSALNLQEIKQSISSSDMPTEAKGILTMSIKRKGGAPLKNFPVAVTSYKQKKTYSTKTDAKGKAKFSLPLNNEYEIDIDGIEEFEYYDIGSAPAFYTAQFTYEPTNIKEVNVRDTITQQLSADAGPSSGRALYKLKVDKRGAGFVKDEPVYLKMLKSNIVYKAKTNAAGEAEFLLPIHRKYMIDFNFSKDVDVLDLSKVRGMGSGGMELGYQPDPKLEFPERYLPKPQDVMEKAFDKFLDAQFNAPKEQYLELYAKWANPEVNAQSKESLLEIGFASQHRSNEVGSKAGEKIPPINICFVLDKSGSMAGYDRIEGLVAALEKASENIRPSDVVSLVVFESGATVLLPASKFGSGQMFREMIKEVNAGGGTSIYDGLEKGLIEVSKYHTDEISSKVILLTDGFGSKTVEEVTDLAKKFTAKGIEISCVGVGQGYNQALLAQLATTSGGMLHFAGSGTSMYEAFQREMRMTLFPIVKAAKIEVFYQDQLLYKSLYGYKPKDIKKGQFNIDLDYMYAGLNKLAVVHFDLNKPTREIENSPVKIKMTYFDFEQQKEVVQEKNVKLKWTDKTGEIDFLVTLNNKKMKATAICNRAIKVMAEANQENDPKKAKRVLQEARDSLKKLFPTSNDQDISMLLTELDSYLLAFNRIINNLRLKKG
jgi:Ca-activated chloride channel family protein